ncbi:MAG: DUF29 domain-containing protein, partial [Halothece sp.]
MSDIDKDYDLWLQQQAKFLEKRQFESLDIDHLVEELEALVRAEKSAVESLTINIMVHLLYCQYWETQEIILFSTPLNPSFAPLSKGGWGDLKVAPIVQNSITKNHWRGEIVNFRAQLESKLTTNLKKHLQTRWEYLYGKAKKISSLKSEIKMPEVSYSLEQVL